MGNSKGLTNICKLTYHFTYQTKNLINGKTYIGRHSTNNLNDGYIGSGTLLKRSVKKYGKENFVCTILSFFDSYEESVEEEKWLVSKEYCMKQTNYNIVEGGSNPILYGEMNPSWKGGKSKYIKTNKPRGLKGELNPMFGKTHTTESIQQAIIKKKEKGLLRGVIVDGTSFESLAACSRNFCINESTVLSRCISPHFPNWEFQDEDYGKIQSEMYYKKVERRYERKRSITENNKKPLFSVNGVVFYIFKEAEKILGCHTETIQKRCVDKNFPNWKFLTEELENKYKEIVSKRLIKESKRGKRLYK